MSSLAWMPASVAATGGLRGMIAWRDQAVSATAYPLIPPSGTFSREGRRRMSAPLARTPSPLAGEGGPKGRVRGKGTRSHPPNNATSLKSGEGASDDHTAG